jgi:hypothetical protein
VTKIKPKRLPSSFRSVGVVTEAPPPKKRIVGSFQGPEMTGKTWLACGAPDPIGYLAFDPGVEGVVDKYMRQHPEVLIGLKEYAVPQAGVKGSQEQGRKIWNEFHDDYSEMMADDEVATVVVDTATEAWELARLACFGRLEKIPPVLYTEVNNDFRQLLRMARESDKNVIFIHKIKKEWVSSKDQDGKTKSDWFGNWERAGFADLGYNVHVQLETFKRHTDKGTEFGFMVLDCRQNPAIEQLTFTGEDASFSALIEQVFPE